MSGLSVSPRWEATGADLTAEQPNPVPRTTPTELHGCEMR